jgi:hypothetical protein
VICTSTATICRRRFFACTDWFDLDLQMEFAKRGPGLSMGVQPPSFAAFNANSAQASRPRNVTTGPSSPSFAFTVSIIRGPPGWTGPQG